MNEILKYLKEIGVEKIQIGFGPDAPNIVFDIEEVHFDIPYYKGLTLELFKDEVLSKQIMVYTTKADYYKGLAEFFKKQLSQ